MAPFSVIIFGFVVWTIAVSGAKQPRFRLKTDQCGRGLRGEGVAQEQPRTQDLSSYCPLGRALAPGGGKMRDPGNEVGSRALPVKALMVPVVARFVFIQRQY